MRFERFVGLLFGKVTGRAERLLSVHLWEATPLSHSLPRLLQPSSSSARLSVCLSVFVVKLAGKFTVRMAPFDTNALSVIFPTFHS